MWLAGTVTVNHGPDIQGDCWAMYEVQVRPNGKWWRGGDDGRLPSGIHGVYVFLPFGGT